MFDIVTLGEALIDLASLDPRTHLKDVQTFKKVAGGAPFNVAVGASKLGKRSAFISRVGTDAFGDHIEEILETYGVDSSALQRDDEYHTGLAFFGLPTPVTREFLFYRNPSSDMMISFYEIPKTHIHNTKVFHFGSISLISDVSKDTTIGAVREAKSSGSIISYDPNLRISLWPDEVTARESIIDEIPNADIIKVNDEELAFLFEGMSFDKAIDELLSMGVSIVLVTKGEHGSVLATANLRKEFPIIESPAVDSTGCGDSFYSGFLSRICDFQLSELLMDTTILEQAVLYGTAAAAITATEVGVTGVMPTCSQVEDFLSTLS